MADKVTRFTDNEVVTTAVFNQRVDETNAGFAAVDEAIDGLAGTGGEIPAIKEKDIQQDTRLETLETNAANTEQDIATNNARDDAQDTQIAEQGTTIGQHGAAIADLQADAHTHTNKSVLDGITAEKVEVWDNPTTAAFYTVPLPASGWTGTGPYVQTVAVEGILETDNPVADVVLSENAADAIAETEAWAAVGRIVTMAGQIAVTCYEDKPVRDITIQLKVVR